MELCESGASLVFKFKGSQGCYTEKPVLKKKSLRPLHELVLSLHNVGPQEPNGQLREQVPDPVCTCVRACMFVRISLARIPRDAYKVSQTL